MSESSYSPRLNSMTTRWSLIQRAHTDMRTSAVDARRVLVLRYAPAIKSYARGITKDESAADELAQEVVLRIMQGDFAGADPTRGRFRDFLKTVIRNMVRNHWSREQRRAAVSFDRELEDVSAANDTNLNDSWDQPWRNRVLELAWSALRDCERQSPQSSAFSVLRLRAEFPDDSIEQLAERFSLGTAQPIRADAFRQKLRRARVQFAECLVNEVADGLTEPTMEDIEDELVQLKLLDQVRSLLPEDWTLKPS